MGGREKVETGREEGNGEWGREIGWGKTRKGRWGKRRGNEEERDGMENEEMEWR